MVEIRDNYPHGMKDKDIEEAIKSYSGAIFDARAHINDVLRYVPLIQLGQIELQGRQAKRVTRFSIVASLLSLAVAGVALYVSLVASKSSSEWESKQLELLGNLKVSIESGVKTTVEATNNVSSKSQDANRLNSYLIIEAINKLQEKQLTSQSSAPAKDALTCAAY